MTAVVRKDNIALGMTPDNAPAVLSLLTRLEHVFMLGGSGSGKTRALLHYMRQLISLGEGLLFLDPHANDPDSNYRNLLAWLSDRPIHVIDFNAPRVVGFNPLACPDDTDPSVIVGYVMAAMNTAWEVKNFRDWPTLERNLRNLLTVCVELKLTLCEMRYLIEKDDDHGLRNYALQHVRNRNALEELKHLDNLARDRRRPRDFEQEVVATKNRLAPLFASPAVEAALGQRDNCLDFRKILDNGEIVLVNLSGGKQIDVAAADLFGRLFIRTISFQASLRENRRPFNLVIDEAHRFLSSDIPTLLTEIRKYGVSVLAAMQNLSQAPDEAIQHALLSVNTKIAFRLGHPDDAETMAKALVPLNLERPVEALIRPTVVGHRRIRLANESESKNHAHTRQLSKTDGTTEGMSETDSQTEQESESESEQAVESSAETKGEYSGKESKFVSKTGGTSATTGKTVTTGTAYTYALTRSFARTRSHTTGDAYTHGHGRSKGTSEALEPILEDRPSAVHSMQNELYGAAQLLMSLPRSVAYISSVGQGGILRALFQVPPVFTRPLPDFDAIRERAMAGYLTKDEAAAAITEREEEIRARAAPAEKPKKPRPQQKPSDPEKLW